MKVAALTFVFNEAINLPIWIRYYGSTLGEKNLYVIDRESTDGSTSNLGEVNRIIVPRDAFDDRKKADFMSSMQNALLNYYDAVVCGDCDELVVPNLCVYTDLMDYASKMDIDHVACVGLNVLHILNHEPPIDLSKPILAQRRFARFVSATCKTQLSRVPIKWLPGLHCLNRRPIFDPNLFMLHTKTMDYGVSSARQKINNETVWSDDSLGQNFGAHHRYEFEQFVRESFFDPVNIINQGKIQTFDFAEEIAKIDAEIVERDQFFWFPMNIVRWVELPAKLRTAF
jgi:Glycosyl transferase family 2